MSFDSKYPLINMCLTFMTTFGKEIDSQYATINFYITCSFCLINIAQRLS